MAEKENEFWRRYPKRYVFPSNGKQKFQSHGYVTEMHEKWIDDHYFNFVGSIQRYPRYKNKRVMDPQVKMFLDANNVEVEPTWGLPTPNEEASYKSVAKYAKDWVNLPPEKVSKMNLAWTWMSRHFSPYMGESDVISLDEALGHLDMSTASGCPFNEEFMTKGELFENDPDIVQWLEEDWERLSKDILWTTLFTSSLKEELRTAAKIEANSIRTFAAGAVDCTVHGTRLFVNMNEKLYASHLKSASVIGMSPFKGNWNKLYTKLNVFKNGYALDETAYDSSLRDYVMWGCAKFRWTCLKELDRTPENLFRIKVYYRNLVNTVLISAEGILIQKKAGNPSGSVNTVTDNTLILYWLLAYAWIETCDPDMLTLSAFEEHTSKALLGDDNTWTVSDYAHKFYNGRSVINVWKTLGVITTTDSLEPRLARDLDFLSAHTVFIKGRAVPLYDRNKLMQSLLYANSKHLTPETTLTRVCCLLQIGWTDLPMRKYCKSLIQFLLEKYDEVLANDQRWIIAKCNIQTDDFYERLVLGDGLVLMNQSYREPEERSTKPYKNSTMELMVKPTQNKQKKRAAKQRSGPIKGISTAQKQKQQLKQRPAQKVRQTARTPDIRTRFNIPNCAMDYLSALAMPFETPAGACIPAEVFPLPSQKTKVYLKGRFQCGTTGVGFISVSPVLCHDSACVSSTTASSVGTASTPFISITNKVDLPLPQIPFASSAFAAKSVAGRIVSYGLRVKYIGQLMSRNGVATAVEEPDHQNLYSLSVDGINASPYSCTKRVGDDEWDQMVFYSGPVASTDLEFQSAIYPLGNSIALISVEGMAGDSYEFEFVEHIEYVGLVAVSKSPSHADPVTFSKALEAAKGVTGNGPITYDKVADVVSGFIQGVRDIAPSLITGGKVISAVMSGKVPAAFYELAVAYKQPNLAALKGT